MPLFFFFDFVSNREEGVRSWEGEIGHDGCWEAQSGERYRRVWLSSQMTE
jgi:hypothetical protein